MSINKHVLITGATGFLGRHLVQFISERPGLAVWGISKGGGQVGKVRVEPVDLGSFEEVSAWREGKPRFDTVFHLAAVVPKSFDSIQAEESFLTNVAMTKNALSLAICDETAFIYASGTSVYGVNRSIPMTEEMIPRPDNLYSLAKYVGEGLSEVAHIQHGIETTALRISAPYGPHQRIRTVINTFLRAALQSRELTLYGTGERVQDFTYISDIMQAFWLAYENRACGIYNIASGWPVTMRELAETVLSVVLDSKSQIVFLDRPDPQESYRGVFDIGKAQRELGYAPQTTLFEGLRNCLAAPLEE